MKSKRKISYHTRCYRIKLFYEYNSYQNYMSVLSSSSNWFWLDIYICVEWESTWKRFCGKIWL